MTFSVYVWCHHTWRVLRLNLQGAACCWWRGNRKSQNQWGKQLWLHQDLLHARSCELCSSFSNLPCIYLGHQHGLSQRSWDVLGTAQEEKTFSDLTSMSWSRIRGVWVAGQGFLVCQVATCFNSHKHSKSLEVEEEEEEEKSKEVMEKKEREVSWAPKSDRVLICSKPFQCQIFH